MKIIKQMMLVTLLLILVTSIASAQGIPQATNPEEVGLSKERLQRISAWIQTDVDKESRSRSGRHGFAQRQDRLLRSVWISGSEKKTSL